MAREAGFLGAQMLPIRGATGEEPEAYLFEGPWNAVRGWWQPLLRRLGESGEKCTWYDWLLFPNPKTCAKIVRTMERRGIPRIWHDPKSAPAGSLIEVCPELDMTADAIASMCEETGNRLVLDTRHLIRPRRGGGPNLLLKDNNWHYAVEQWAPHTEVLHFNVIGEGNRDTTNEIARFVRNCAELAGHEKLTVVAEFMPTRQTMQSRSACEAEATVMLHRMMEHTC